MQHYQVSAIPPHSTAPFAAPAVKTKKEFPKCMIIFLYVPIMSIRRIKEKKLHRLGEKGSYWNFKELISRK